ncbi:hypothetical protein OIU34_20045 [Pararhizobium sp. BT-229]|uniref:hypothetical protein n=1 Tax=Pararhizobium sp. BT-229 TaxID=2986923 RepID=UPI0021F7FB50|nr:hypothetical protein [Pararhizobium sp. BT-229]MCV9964179.1 hypothetical protein [Pararhizobium sp. BT-229]
MHRIDHGLADRIRAHMEEAAATVYGREVSRRMEEGSSFVRDPKAENVILQDWRFAYLYSREFIRGRWQAFEDAIAAADPVSDPSVIRCVYNYVKNVRKERMVTAEKHIANCATSSVDYSFNILGTPWRAAMEHGEAANETISRHPTAASAYRIGM